MGFEEELFHELATSTWDKRSRMQQAMECVQYYGGTVAGACGIFSACPEVGGVAIQSIFGPEDISGYATYPVHDCPLCKQKAKLEALVNGYGYSKL